MSHPDSNFVRKSRADELFAQRDAHLGGLPAHILLDLARNESAPREWRKAAVELLLDKGYAQANHPELMAVRMEIKAERAARTEVEAVVETAVEQDISGGSHVDFGGRPVLVVAGREVLIDPDTTTTYAPVEVTPSITCGVTTKNLMQDEVFPVPPTAADCFVDPHEAKVVAVEPETPHEFVE